MSASVAAALRAFVPEMRRLFGPNLRRIILFGSQARGEARPDSDVDVLLLFEELVTSKPVVRDQIIEVTHELLLDHQALITTILSTEQQYAEMAEPLFYHIQNEGIELMQNEQLQLMELANTTLKDAVMLQEQTQGYRSAVSRAYYSMFYAAEAALLSHDLRPKSHVGLISQFSQQIIRSGLIEQTYGKQLQRAFEIRQEGDYKISAAISATDADRTIQDARAFIDRVQRYLTDGAGQ